MLRAVPAILVFWSSAVLMLAANEPILFFKNKSTDYALSVEIRGRGVKLNFKLEPGSEFEAHVDDISDAQTVDVIEIGYVKIEPDGSRQDFSSAPFYPFNLVHKAPNDRKDSANYKKIYLKFEGVASDAMPILSPQEGDWLGKTSQSKITKEKYSVKNNIKKDDIKGPEPVQKVASIAEVKPTVASASKQSWKDATVPTTKVSTTGAQIGAKSTPSMQKPAGDLVEKYVQMTYSDQELEKALERLGFDKKELYTISYEKEFHNVGHMSVEALIIIEDEASNIVAGSWNRYYGDGDPNKLKYLIKGYVQFKHFENGIKGKSSSVEKDLAELYPNLRQYLNYDLLKRDVFESHSALGLLRKDKNEQAMQNYVRDNKLTAGRVVDLINRFFTDPSFKV